jgi:hypothetical protein
MPHCVLDQPHLQSRECQTFYLNNEFPMCRRPTNSGPYSHLKATIGSKPIALR